MTIEEKEQKGLNKFASHVTQVLVSDEKTGSNVQYESIKMAADALGVSASAVYIAIKRQSLVRRKYRITKIAEKKNNTVKAVYPRNAFATMYAKTQQRTYFDWKNHKPYGM